MGWILAGASAQCAASPLLTTAASATPALGPAEWVHIALLVAAPTILVILWYRDVIRPGSFARHPGRSVSPHPWWVWLLAGAVVFMSWTMGAAFAASAWNLTPLDHDSLAAQSVIGLSSYLVGAVAGAFMVWLLASRGASAGLRLRWSDLPVGLGAILFTLPIVHAVSICSLIAYRSITSHEPEAVGHTMLEVMLENRTDPWVWGLVAAAIVGAPIIEELLYRVFMQSGLRALFRSAWAAILVTSAVFAVIHLGSVHVYALPTLFTLAVAMGIVYERTGRIGAPIAMHMAFNSVNIALAALVIDA